MVRLMQPKPRKRRSEILPEHLPCTALILELSESMAVCRLHGPRRVIGYDTTEIYFPAT